MKSTRMTNFSDATFEKKAAGFDRPTQLPRSEEERRQWQAANKAWWESAPMRYDWRQELAQSPGSEAYFKEIDRRFFASARTFMPWRDVPFDAVIPFDDLGDKDVLEIGVGQGTHAQLLAARCKSFTGIDLTSAAAAMSARRFKLFDIPGTVLQMDAERMGFGANSFDYVWSWGVVHQSADTQRVLSEIHRVLRPGGKCTVMVYYRSWWNYHVSGFLRGVFLGQWRKLGSLHHVSQSGTDGAIARYYKPDEWRAATRDLFVLDSMRIYGLKSDVVPLPHGRLKQVVMDLIPDALARFMTCRLRMGSLLVAHMRKRGAQ
jgi:ubiquinone/menaquinone biosynthesis C-methylase UbiE